jgi:hypothetical protein
MNNLDNKLSILKRIIDNGDRITIAIFGLGSVGNYLLDYLVSLGDPKLRIVVIGRNAEKLEKDVNIVKTAACIRNQLISEIIIIPNCDFFDISSIKSVLEKVNPNFIVNCSRLYPGLKYGSISWSKLRAYGIWAPLSVQLAKNIMEAYVETDCSSITINTSYSDAVIPWLKSAGMGYFDFGSGNLNHLIPRIKFAVAKRLGIDSFNDIDITLAASHFHDVVISKEGHTEGIDLPLMVKYKGSVIDIPQSEIFADCAISMPVDQKRNMMNASSNFEIIHGILKSLRENTAVKLHSPGVLGHIGGYPIIIDTSNGSPTTGFATEFSLEEMEEANRKSIFFDGIEDVKDGYLIYSDILLAKVQNAFGVSLPKFVHLSEAEEISNILFSKIIRPALDVVS